VKVAQEAGIAKLDEGLGALDLAVEDGKSGFGVSVETRQKAGAFCDGGQSYLKGQDEKQGEHGTHAGRGVRCPETR
jgi:hypothetical protein